MLSSDVVKDYTLSIRLTQDEKKVLLGAAERAGVTPSQWVRNKIREKLGSKAT